MILICNITKKKQTTQELKTFFFAQNYQHFGAVFLTWP